MKNLILLIIAGLILAVVVEATVNQEARTAQDVQSYIVAVLK